jgi:hypothetical protein
MAKTINRLTCSGSTYHNLIQTDSDIDLSNIKKEISASYFITGEAYTRTWEGKTLRKNPVH